MKLPYVQLTVAIASYIPLCSAYPKLVISGGSNTVDEFDNFRGWSGAFLIPLLNVSTISNAVAKSSLRSTYNTPLWDRTLNLVRKGDFFVFEFGLDDEGDPQEKFANGTLVNPRASLPGTGDETVNVTYTVYNGTVAAKNVTAVVHTFGWYLKNMIIDVRDRGDEAYVIVSSRIPKNWQTVTGPGNKTTSTLPTEYKFRDYARQVAQELKTEFVDHTKYSLRHLQELGPVESKKLYGFRSFQAGTIKPGPDSNSDTYTNKAGGKANANTFVQALRCAGSEMANYLSADGLAVEKVVC